MRSRFADEFNHDEEAPGYDGDVEDESQPVRRGYRSVLSSIGAQVAPGSTVLDLGSGTGNTILALPPDCRVTAVDISIRMTDIARAKLSGRSVSFHTQDILEYVASASLAPFESIVSTYVLHHLTSEERHELFTLVYNGTAESIQVLVGDLMFEDTDDRARILDKYRTSDPDVAEGFEEEFYWNVRETEQALSQIGWITMWQRFSDLSWTVRLTKTKSGVPRRRCGEDVPGEGSL